MKSKIHLKCSSLLCKLANIAWIALLLTVSATATSAPKFEFGGFEGKVIDSETGAPINDAEVVVTWSIEAVTFPQARFAGYVHLANATTNREGRFVIQPSEVIKVPERDYRIRLKRGTPTMWIYHEKHRPDIVTLKATTSMEGIPFFTWRTFAKIDKDVIVSLKNNLDIRHELHDLSNVMDVSGFFETGACNYPVIENFVRRILKRQHELIPTIKVISPWRKYTFECRGMIYEYYDYYGYYHCNSNHSECSFKEN